MTDKNKTEIVVILDRSGSMMSIQKDMVGGFNTFIEEQKKVPGKCSVSLYQFDTEYGVVYEQKDLNEVPSLELVPRGGTALLDAVGLTSVAVGARLAKLPEEQRPGAVILLIITDGQENSSKEYTYEMVRKTIETQEKTYAWKYVYLGCDASTMKEGGMLGIANTSSYKGTGQGVNAMYGVVSRSVGSYRNAVAAAGSSAVCDFNIAAEIPEEPEETSSN